MMKWIMCCVALGWMGVAQAANIQMADFANGARLVVQEDHSSPVAMVQVWLKVGGRDEVPGKTGLAHVFEHMMFKGSDALKPGQYSKTIAAMGGNDNAFTSHDFTAYFETVPAAKVDTVLGMEAERFAHLSLGEKEFSKEIRVIMEERRMRTEDDPNSHMFEELSAAALRLHPYRNPVIGWMQDLEQLKIQDVRAFYKQHYVARNATVVIVGDVDFKHVKTIVAKTFGAMPNVQVPPRFNPKEPEPLGAKRVNVHLPAKSPMVAITLPVPVWEPGKNDTQAAALAVATYILGSGRTALLQQRLVNTQRKAFSADAGYDPFGMGLDLWYAYGMLGAKQSTKDFETAFWAVLKDMAEHPVSKHQLQTAQHNMVASQVFAQDSLYLRAKLMGRMETVGIGAQHMDDWIQAIKAVKASDVQKVVQQFLRPERATTGVLIPEVTS